MQYYNMYLANAFTDKAFEGNATGIVISAGRMTDEEMQNVAKDLDQSVTVFIKRLDVGLYETRFFRPDREIKLCGHATIATFFALSENEYIQRIDDGVVEVNQITQLGKIPVQIEYKESKIERVNMILDVKSLEKQISDEKILEAIGIKEEDLSLNGAILKPKKISTGGADIVIPVKSVEILEKIKIDYDKVLELSKEEDIISFQVFTIEKSGEKSYVRQRTFSPSIGVEEESGSGTSTGATLYYINRYISEETNKIESVQGIELGRKSRLCAEVIDENTIKVGGIAFVFMNGVLNI